MTGAATVPHLQLQILVATCVSSAVNLHCRLARAHFAATNRVTFFFFFFFAVGGGGDGCGSGCEAAADLPLPSLLLLVFIGDEINFAATKNPLAVAGFAYKYLQINIASAEAQT